MHFSPSCYRSDYRFSCYIKKREEGAVKATSRLHLLLGHIVSKSPQMSHLWYFPMNLVLLKLTCLVTLFDRQLQFFFLQKTIFGIFNELLSIRKEIVSICWMRVFCDFQTPWCRDTTTIYTQKTKEKKEKGEWGAQQNRSREQISLMDIDPKLSRPLLVVDLELQQ